MVATVTTEKGVRHMHGWLIPLVDVGDVAHPTWRAAIWVVAALTAASGVFVAVRMYETHPRGQRESRPAPVEG